MKSLFFGSLTLVALFAGCGGDGTCCKDMPVEKAIGIPPVAKITGLADKTTISLGQTVTADGIGSSDRDGQVTGYQWMLDGKNASTEVRPSFTLNEAGVHEICLTVTDNNGNVSANTECRSITVLGANNTTPVLPTAVIDLSNDTDLSDYSKHTFSCENSHDNDALGTGKEIVACEWNIQSYAIDDNGNEVPYRNCTADVISGHEIYICPKASKIVAKLTVTDNDGQQATTTKEYLLHQ